ncbi:voltage dependent anion channel [Klebsormidium nitens]|uniref:Voltage dependent anion channel n=1 Tax=Klebsormidium nitens TaxID=105231 RepID=A0A0U9HJ78_KLENI|nr:voltage dependent anion channel [Klebsormidium nitens]|eukprot:GAQ81844.1 voltage dependent anion channel [Klebsormidium nitens]
MAKGPAFFGDIGKQTKDLLTKDFTTEQKVTINSTTSTGLVLSSTGTKKGEAALAEVKACYKKNNLQTEWKIDSASKIHTTTTVNDLAPGLKAIIKGTIPDSQSGKFDIEYVRGLVGLKGSIGLKQSPVAEGSIAIGKDGVLVGGEGAYDTNKGEVTKYTAGVQYSQKDFSAAAILADKGNKLTASYYHSVNVDTAVGVEVAHKFDDNANTFTAGTAYRLDPLTLTKMRLDNHGKLAALIQHEWRPKNTFTVSSEVDTKAMEKSAKVGLALNIVP